MSSNEYNELETLSFIRNNKEQQQKYEEDRPHHHKYHKEDDHDEHQPPSRTRKRRKRSNDFHSETSSDSQDSSDQSNTSELSSDDETHGKRGHKKKKSKKSKKSHKKEKSRKKSKDKKSKKKKKKKSKSSKEESHNTFKLTGKWGAMGILAATDIYKKEAEFRSWLIEVKNIDIEVLSQTGTKEYFAEYMEDYNTCTLVHPKYYDLDKYHQEERRRKGRTVDIKNTEEVNLKADEELLKRKRKSRFNDDILPETLMTKEQVLELKRITEERVAAEKLRQMGFKPKDTMGVRYESLF